MQSIPQPDSVSLPAQPGRSWRPSTGMRCPRRALSCWPQLHWGLGTRPSRFHGGNMEERATGRAVFPPGSCRQTVAGSTTEGCSGPGLGPPPGRGTRVPLPSPRVLGTRLKEECTSPEDASPREAFFQALHSVRPRDWGAPRKHAIGFICYTCTNEQSRKMENSDVKSKLKRHQGRLGGSIS